MKLFPKENIVGIFRGFSEGGLEFHADLIFSYKNEFQNTPMHGQFVLVQLESENEAVLGRITSVSSEGRLSSDSGEDYGLRAIAEDRPIPEDLRQQYLKYRVDIRVLGVMRLIADKLHFAPSHRRLPHIGSKVAFLCEDVLKDVTGHNIAGAELGYFALGEYVYSGTDTRIEPAPWMQVLSPAVIAKFPVKNLVSRRSFVFARAGFGKSNLVKLLFSSLYRTDPVVEKRSGRSVPVGTVIFDPDGEYFWPDDKGRPGLCDVPELKDKVVVFTSREAPSPFYGSFVAGNIKIDVRRLRPADVISIALSPDKQDQQNVRKLKGLNDSDWTTLVNEIYKNGNATDEEIINRLLRLNANQEAEMAAARANMTAIVRMLHDPSSQLMETLLYALKQGKICIVDVSQMRGPRSLILSGIILQKIFSHNQEEFTKAEPQTIPTIAVVEEAQSVLGSERNSSGEGPYISWVKEGRKYDLGAVLITQQPGSISSDILSQGDNWFIFHLLSSGDLQALKSANAHFSSDLLSSLLNEPIVGNGIFWSGVEGKTYPLSIRVLSFEKQYKLLDPHYNKAAEKTAASKIQQEFEAAIKNVPHREESATEITGDELDVEDGELIEQPADAKESYIAIAIDSIKKDAALLTKIKSQGIPWRGMIVAIADALPSIIDSQERDQLASTNVKKVLDEVLGKNQWKTERRPSKSSPGSTTVWVRIAV